MSSRSPGGRATFGGEAPKDRKRIAGANCGPTPNRVKGRQPRRAGTQREPRLGERMGVSHELVPDTWHLCDPF